MLRHRLKHHLRVLAHLLCGKLQGHAVLLHGLHNQLLLALQLSRRMRQGHTRAPDGREHQVVDQLLLQSLKAGELQRLAVSPHGLQHQLVVFTKSLGAETFDGLVDAFETSCVHDAFDQHLFILDPVTPRLDGLHFHVGSPHAVFPGAIAAGVAQEEFQALQGLLLVFVGHGRAHIHIPHERTLNLMDTPESLVQIRCGGVDGM
mmetsp:Transcript_54327/g.86421  ORF Transcript_54327/g.86421 Transcript_54327/m.86421 type:complete len:204 (-) Transcript_54327:933-1544(-)